jgi:ribosomal protein S8
MLTRIRNAVTAKQTRVDMPASRLKAEIARILQDEGYIQGYKLVDDPAPKTTAAVKTLRLFLKYGPHGERLITGVQRISRPGRRVYFGRDDVPRGGEGRRRRRGVVQYLVGLRAPGSRLLAMPKAQSPKPEADRIQ